MGIFSKLFGAKKNAPKGLTDAAYEGYARAFDGAVLNSIHIQKTAAAAPMAVSTVRELPDIAEQRFGIVDFDEYQQACTRYGCPMNESCSTKLLGYADLIQGDITYECEAVLRGVYCGGSDEGLSDEERAYIQAHAADWVLLAQFDGIHSGGYELDWGDDGCIYFYIKKDDARARDFSKCWCVLQCM